MSGSGLLASLKAAVSLWRASADNKHVLLQAQEASLRLTALQRLRDDETRLLGQHMGDAQPRDLPVALAQLQAMQTAVPAQRLEALINFALREGLAGMVAGLAVGSTRAGAGSMLWSTDPFGMGLGVSLGTNSSAHMALDIDQYMAAVRRLVAAASTGTGRGTRGMDSHDAVGSSNHPGSWHPAAACALLFPMGRSGITQYLEARRHLARRWLDSYHTQQQVPAEQHLNGSRSVRSIPGSGEQQQQQGQQGPGIHADPALLKQLHSTLAEASAGEHYIDVLAGFMAAHAYMLRRDTRKVNLQALRTRLQAQLALQGQQEQQALQALEHVCRVWARLQWPQPSEDASEAQQQGNLGSTGTQMSEGSSGQQQQEQAAEDAEAEVQHALLIAAASLTPQEWHQLRSNLQRLSDLLHPQKSVSTEVTLLLRSMEQEVLDRLALVGRKPATPHALFG